ncbi:MAG: Gfo/Idh/MocA family oxidoreductase [Phycisphaerales bacterium]|nr:Gfo/Idh/MocA family oxidoreductase [Phycisphaerales bacterium]MBT7170493.1 Gfo/Idh/MocA family oxidoreductase [Phycisphaerales bacterium]
MVGGGPTAFIGEVHRKAIRLDGEIELVAGAFDIDPKQSRKMGRMLYLPKKRAYNTYQDMIAGELALPVGERIDFVSITTPNSSHFPIAKAFLEAGFHVVCEKPMTMDVKEAVKLKEIVKKTRKIFMLTHTYTGFPMVKLAKDLVADGKLGKVHKVIVQYHQGWLMRALEKSGQQQAAWRTDPKQAGAAGCMGDIGTHAANLAEYVSGLSIKELCADLTPFVKGRKLDDDGNVLLHFNKGAKGVLTASQVQVGHDNDLAIWVYGENGSLEWHQEHPNQLLVKPIDAPKEIWERGNGYVEAASPAAAKNSRLPGGHPEAYIEAFANLYMRAGEAIRARVAGKKADPLSLDFPTVTDGVSGMKFIEAVVKSKGKWTKIK